MLSFYIKSTLRLIARNKVLSTIKIAGLAIGLATFLLTTLFSLHELAFDTQHPDAQRLYRYIHRVKSPDGTQSFAFASATIGPALKERFPEVEAYHRILPNTVSVRNVAKDVLFNENRFAFADPNFFEFFHFPLRNSANLKTILQEPYAMIITPATAIKYFGDEDPLGKTLVVNNKIECVVKGVFMENFNYSHMNFDFVVSFATLEAIRHDPLLSLQIPAALNLDAKGFAAFYTYLRLAPGASPDNLIAKFPSFIEEFRGKGKSQRLVPTLQAVNLIHLKSDLLYELEQNGSLNTVYVFFCIGALILVIACINYVNISTAEFIHRGRGIGLKKILGVSRISLLLSHLVETILLTAIAVLLGTTLAYLLLPFFNSLVDRQIDFFQTNLLVILGAVLLGTSLIAGLYPAFSISRIATMDTFKGIRISSNPLSLRNSLVFLQILVSFCLVSVSILIYNQLSYLLNKDLGFASKQIIVLNATSMAPTQMHTYKSIMLNNRDITAISGCSVPPGQNLSTMGLTLREHTGDEERRIGVYQQYVDADYLKVLGVKITDGRFFSELSPVDSSKYIILNQAAADIISDSAPILNKEITVPDFYTSGFNQKSVLGVFNNFNYASLHRQVEPLILEFNPDKTSFLMVRYNSNSAEQVVAGLEREWKAMASELPFDFYFLDDGLAKLYSSEQKLRGIVSAFALLAIGLAALGLFGTMLFSVQQKTKEIGIRKALGSNLSSLFLLLAKPVLFLILLSCTIGVPVAYVAGSRWLEQYSYRIGFHPILFLGTFALILTVVMISMVYHFMKVSRINPTEVLRQE